MKKYFQAPWSLRQTTQTVFETVFLVLLAIFAINYFELELQIENEKMKIWVIIGTFIALWVALLTPLLLRTWQHHKISPQHFGLRKIALGRTIKLAIGACLLYHVINALIVVFMFYTNIQIIGYQAQKLFLPTIGQNPLQLALVGTAMVIVGPIVEEVFFRGFLLRALSNKLGLVYASLLTSAVFALFHFQLKVFIPIFILGLIINYLVIHSKSLWPGIAFHVLNSAVVFTVELLILTDIIPLDRVMG